MVSPSTTVVASSSWNGCGNVERTEGGCIPPMERHGASNPKRDRRGEVEGPVPNPVVGEMHRRRTYGGGYRTEIAASRYEATDSANFARGQLARAIIQRGGARFLWPSTWFENWHVGRYLS